MVEVSVSSVVRKRKEKPWPLCDRHATYAELRHHWETQVGNSQAPSKQQASKRTEAGSGNQLGAVRNLRPVPPPAGVPEKPGLLFPRDDGTFHELPHRHVSPCYSLFAARCAGRAIGLSLFPRFLLRWFRLASFPNVTPRRVFHGAHYESASSHGSHAHALAMRRIARIVKKEQETGEKDERRERERETKDRVRRAYTFLIYLFFFFFSWNKTTRIYRYLRDSV